VHGSFPPRVSRRWSLAAALVVGLALRVYVGLTHPIDYNGYWHVFIARNLRREYSGLAHPPFFLLLLKGVDALSHTRLAYRSLSIVSGLLAIALVHRILEKLRTGPAVAWLGALTMATSQSAIFLSRGVQSYMLAVFFILWSFVFYLDIARPEPAGWRRRAAFAVLASLAVATEYFAGLYLVAAALAPLLVAAFRPAYRRALRATLTRRILPDAATLAPPAILGTLLYESIAKPWVTRLNHLPEFYLRPGMETPVGFLTRNLWNLFNLFSPALLWSPRRAAALVLLFAAVAFVAAIVSEARDAEGALPAAVLIVLLVLGMVLGLRGLYPFGGAMRQQFLFFQFALLAGFVAFDRLVSSVPSPIARRALLFLCGAALAVDVVGNSKNFRPMGRDPFTIQAHAFDRSFPQARVVQTDQFNLVGFFIAHHDWAWSYGGALPGLPAVQRYELERDGRRLTLLAHRDRWNFPLLEAGTYTVFRAAGAAAGADCTTAFVVHQNLYKPPDRKLPHIDEGKLLDAAPSLARAGGLTLRRLVSRGDDGYLELCNESGASPPSR
jgi:hypothetical protein